MRATQFVRRGLVAFAAVATLTLGLSGVASAQGPGALPGTSPGAVVSDDDAIVWVPIPGYAYDIVTVDGAPSAVLAVGIVGGLFPVVVEFQPDIDGAAIITPGAIEDVVASRVSGD
jgi:hypothetical protein